MTTIESIEFSSTLFNTTVSPVSQDMLDVFALGYPGYSKYVLGPVGSPIVMTIGRLFAVIPMASPSGNQTTPYTHP